MRCSESRHLLDGENRLCLKEANQEVFRITRKLTHRHNSSSIGRRDWHKAI